MRGSMTSGSRRRHLSMHLTVVERSVRWLALRCLKVLSFSMLSPSVVLTAGAVLSASAGLTRRRSMRSALMPLEGSPRVLRISFKDTTVAAWSCSRES